MGRSEQRRDPTDGQPPLRQPSLPIAGAQSPLRACLLSGGASRRMGCDKALLPHREGGSWLEHTLRLLLQLDLPVTLLSRHARHRQLARALAAQPGPTPVRLTAVAEPEPWQGPLLALHRLMQRYPDQRLLLCPVDMPWLRLEVLQNLRQAAAEEPQRIHLAHDGERRQPLLGIYPSGAARRDALSAAIRRGERRLQGWLAGQDCREVRLEPAALRNVNSPLDLPAAPSDFEQRFPDHGAPASGAEEHPGGRGDS